MVEMISYGACPWRERWRHVKYATGMGRSGAAGNATSDVWCTYRYHHSRHPRPSFTADATNWGSALTSEIWPRGSCLQETRLRGSGRVDSCRYEKTFRLFGALLMFSDAFDTTFSMSRHLWVAHKHWLRLVKLGSRGRGYPEDGDGSSPPPSTRLIP